MDDKNEREKRLDSCLPLAHKKKERLGATLNLPSGGGYV